MNGVRAPKTADIVAAHIRALIIRGELSEGDYLQPEAQLIERFGTSRPTLREAVRILENEGFISIKRGSRNGARVHGPSVERVARSAGVALQADGASLAGVYEARLAIEPFAARLAAGRRDAATIAALRAAFVELGDLLTAKAVLEYRVRIARFHLLLVKASGNRTLTLMAATLEEVLESHQARYRESPARVAALKGPARARFYAKGMSSLERIIDLIEAGDGSAAEAHWRAHLEAGNRVWLSGYSDALLDVLD